MNPSSSSRLPAIVAGLCLAALCSLQGAVFTEDFTAPPSERGWKTFGDTTLFAWNSKAHCLQVTWASSRTNGLFYRKLDLPLNKLDAFSFEFDLRLREIQGGFNPDKPGPFEIAIGFISYTNATNTAFSRGNLACPNLVEFDYFPSGSNTFSGGMIDPTVSPIIVLSNRSVKTSFTYPLEITVNDLYHIAVSYFPATRTLSTMMTRNGQPVGPVNNVVLSSSAADFRVDTFSINSYSDSGDPYSSVLARGELTSVTLTTPDLPAINGSFTNGLWQVQFDSRSNCLYALERSLLTNSWIQVSPWTQGSDTRISIKETNHPAGNAWFYRLHLLK